MSDPWQGYLQTQGTINGNFVWGLQQVPVMARNFALFDLAVLAAELVSAPVVTFATVGIGDIAEGGFDVILVVSEFAVIGIWIIGDALIWAVCSLVALGIAGVENAYVQIVHAQSIPYPKEWTVPGRGTQTLPKSSDARAERLWDQYRKSIGKDLTAKIVAFLALYCSIKKAEQILDNWDQFKDVLAKLNSDKLNEVNESIALLNAIIDIGPQNIEGFSDPYIWRDKLGNPVKNRDTGQDIKGDVDIVTKNNPPWYVEVGPHSKGKDPGHFRIQLSQLVIEANHQSPPAIPKCYLLMPSVPMSSNQAKEMGSAIQVARSVLDGDDIETFVDPQTGAIDPPFNSNRVNIMYQPDKNCTA